VDRDAVVLRARDALTVVSSAIVGGGLGRARGIINIHVGGGFQCEQAEATIQAMARGRGIPSPYVGLLTAARTEAAEIREEEDHGVTALAVVTVGLSNPITAGLTPFGPAPISTINTIVIIDAMPEPAALINAITTIDEVKTSVLLAAGVKGPDGRLATGTSTDAIAIGATGRGRRCRFGGPVSELGSVVARATRGALEAGVARWMKERR
jgi:iron complex transport system ATP-binding protein